MGESVYRSLRKNAGKALHEHQMIADGDRVVVGLSGGKDSMTLLWILNERLSRIPIRYELFPVHIDPGFPGGPADELAAYCREQGMNLRVERTDYGLVAHSPVNRENPCFLCARLRRRRLFEAARELGCRKIALGHNKDDLIETLFLNMCYAGEISTMLPRQPFFEGKYEVIRPLAYCDEDAIRRFARSRSFPQFVNPCPSAENSRRKDLKDLLSQLYRSNPKIKGNIFRSMRRVKHEYLPPSDFQPPASPQRSNGRADA